MPVQKNWAIQNQPRVAWTGAANRPIDIRKFVGFAFAFEVTTDLTADAVFAIESAPPSLADHCVPGAFTSVPEIANCTGEAVGTVSQVTIPNGTKAGTVCTGTIPCRPNAFVRLVAVSGPTNNVLAAAVLSGPK
jgi:hypothetical protein